MRFCKSGSKRTPSVWFCPVQWSAKQRSQISGTSYLCPFPTSFDLETKLGVTTHIWVLVRDHPRPIVYCTNASRGLSAEASAVHWRTNAITVEHRLQKHLQNYLYRDYNMPHPKFCNMLHADRVTLLWQIRLSVCLSVRLSVRLYCSNRWKWGWYGQKLRAWTVPGIALTKIYHKTGSNHNGSPCLGGKPYSGVYSGLCRCENFRKFLTCGAMDPNEKVGYRK